MNTTKIFFDLEFTGLHQNTTIISIGLKTQDGQSFYAEFNDFDKRQLDQWLKDNVISKLYLQKNTSNKKNSDFNGRVTEVFGDSYFVKDQLEKWLSKFEKIEMWGDCLAYDWVLFCQLFGGAMFIPKNIFYIPFDISTLFLEKGLDPDTNRANFIEIGGWQHNALFDASVIMSCYEKLQLMPSTK